MSLNATFAGSSSHLTASQLYAASNVDYTQLNWFEQQWMAWYLWIENPLIATGIASFILHEVRPPSPTRQRTAFSSSHADRLFRSLHTVDHHRCYPLLPQVEIATCEDSYTAGAVGMYQECPLLTLYR